MSTEEEVTRSCSDCGSTDVDSTGACYTCLLKKAETGGVIKGQEKS